VPNKNNILVGRYCMLSYWHSQTHCITTLQGSIADHGNIYETVNGLFHVATYFLSCALPDADDIWLKNVADLN
jgi:hypothetical protein